MNITPTVGRKVWFYESDQQVEPIDATVIRVHSKDNAFAWVNLRVTDPETGAWRVESVTVGDENTEGPHYRWMPYQKQQAEKAASAD